MFPTGTILYDYILYNLVFGANNLKQLTVGT